MKRSNLTTTLNVKIFSVVLLLMITTTVYNHWLSLQEENEKNIKYLVSITDFLIKKKPVDAFSEIATRQSGNNVSFREQVLALNEELQPIFKNILIPINIIKFGFYSRQHENIVAVGPHSDQSLLFGIDPTRINAIYNSNTEQLLEINNSLIWHGATTLIYIKPIEEHGVIVGCAFAAINQDAVSSTIWKRTANTFFAAFLMLLVCITIFRELFVQLKKDLTLFAESILSGQSYNYSSEIAEFTPILNYISEQTEKMTRLDRLNIIGEMAAGIAHEIRNPMTTVRGLLQFIGNKQEFAKQKENFALMIDELDRANGIITEFLSLAKDREMEFSKANLNTIIQDIYPLLQADALCNDCEILLNLNTLPNVSVDLNGIRQLILNMVRNGLDATPGHGVINISTNIAGSKVVLSISDSGIGIPEEIINKIGTPFFTTKENGTGLGLAICYRIVQQHAATLTVDSNPLEGTTFTIAFDPV